MNSRHLKLVGREGRAELPVDPSSVLVVGKSSINRVVVAKIVEKCGLKPVSESLEMAAGALRSVVPGVVVLDGGPDNRDCDELMPHIEAVRRAAGPGPSVILLSMKGGTPQSLDLSNLVDAVVTKPITPESLQPVIDRLSGGRRS